MSNATEGTRLRTLATLVMGCILSLFLLACGGASTAEPADQGPAGEAEQSNRGAARRLLDPSNAEETPAPGDAPGDGTGSETAATAAWQTLAPLAAGARQETAVVALSGEIYLLGGFDAERRIVATVEAYSPAADQWRRVADLPQPLHHANAAALDGRIYVVGFLTAGFVGDGRTFVYDPEFDAWESGQPMPAGTERGASGVAVIAGQIYVAGGLRFGAVDDFSVYTPATDTWATLPDLPVARDHLVGGGIAGFVVMAGGRGGAIGAVTGRVDAFDPAARRWSIRAPLPTPRGGVAGAVLDGRLYVIGGEGNAAIGSGVFAEVEAYDPETDRWTSLPPMTTPRHGTGAAALLSRIYVPGGATQQGFGAVATHERLTP